MAFEVDGIEWNGEEIAAELKVAMVRGLGIAAEHILAVSNQRVPLEEGTLERSGGTDTDLIETAASIFYDTPYAVVQHEDLSFRHDQGRQAKYLESAVNEERDTALALVAAELAKKIGG